jgi:hypothetical protein
LSCSAGRHRIAGAARRGATRWPLRFRLQKNYNKIILFIF